MDHPLLQQIKEQTKESHSSLEQLPILHSLTSSDINQLQYLKILIKFYGFFSPLENAINQYPQIQNYLPDIETRRKASSLYNDINIISRKEDTKPLFKECHNLPAVANPAQAMGCLYVMEGSTLGGRFIYKNLEKNLQITDKDGASFFYGYGPETGEKWKKFQAGLSFFAEETPHETSKAITAAVDTFEKLKLWFNN
jgi:heme oxygenase (biliverdin-IX-beta and delta-forming)